MSTYVIGDVQGCFDQLLRLLEKIQFDSSQDSLWFTGDLVNRGPRSLEVLRFVKALGNRAITVLGNHDLALLATACGALAYQSDTDTFQDVLDADDCDELIDWLRHRPLLHHDATLGYTLVHAGLHPQWDLNTALSLAKELETTIQGSTALAFFNSWSDWHTAIDTSSVWDPNLAEHNRLRFIANCLTRLRFCSAEGALDLDHKESTTKRSDYFPWFSIPARANRDLKILFGHWASLKGECSEANVFALDTGCVWGNCLTAMRLEDGLRFSESCQELIREEESPLGLL